MGNVIVVFTINSGTVFQTEPTLVNCHLRRNHFLDHIGPFSTVPVQPRRDFIHLTDSSARFRKKLRYKCTIPIKNRSSLTVLRNDRAKIGSILEGFGRTPSEEIMCPSHGAEDWNQWHFAGLMEKLCEWSKERTAQTLYFWIGAMSLL
jgi:hypothetical protein